MILAVVLEGLTCASCETDGELWHDVLLGVVECRACGDRTVYGDDFGPDDGAYETDDDESGTGGGWYGLA